MSRLKYAGELAYCLSCECPFCEGREVHWQIEVGWNNPLDTFFAQVWVTAEDPWEDPVPELWVGTSVAEITTVEHLDSWLSPYGEIPKEIKVLLEKDRLERISPTPISNYLRDIFDSFE